MTQGRANKPPRARKTGIKYIPFSRYDDLLAGLVSIVERGDWVWRRDGLALMLGLHGLRVSEVRNLTVRDLDSADKVLTVATLKRGQPRKIELGVGVAEAIVDWRDGALCEPLLFTITGKPVHPSHWQRRVREITGQVQALDAVGSDRPSDCFHSLRHTYAMRLLHKTGNTALVMARIGHRNLTSTQEYIGAYGQLGDRQLAQIGNDIAVVPALACAKPVGRLHLFAG